MCGSKGLPRVSILEPSTSNVAILFDDLETEVVKVTLHLIGQVKPRGPGPDTYYPNLATWCKDWVLLVGGQLTLAIAVSI